MADSTQSILILGSGPNAPEASQWPRAWFDRIVVINNAWRVRPDWDHLICPEDFPHDRRPSALQPAQSMIEADQFVPAQNVFGGFVFAGGTMAFTAGYWALHALRPRIMAFMGCDMVYPTTGKTHFYGTGTADPLRPDPTLQDLGAKSARLGLLAAREGCRCVNLSSGSSELLFERADPDRLRELPAQSNLGAGVEALLDRESTLGYFVPTGRYWEQIGAFEQDALADLDAGWRAEWQSPKRAGCAA